MGNQIRHLCNRKTKVKEIHIKRPLNCSEISENEVVTSEGYPNLRDQKDSSPTPTDILNQQDETISLKMHELTREQFESQIEVERNVNSSSHLFNAQQKLISRLERELACAHSDTSELKLCYEQKLKKSRSNIAIIRVESALIIYEMRENVKKLEFENGELVSKLQNIEKSESERDTNRLTDAHTELILNLSEQLLAANEKLRDTNTLVESLKQNNNNTPQLNSNIIDIRT